jgi:HD superfamily phosphohydrolase
VALLDTPLFQRLRGIRQLAFAHLVYPTLGYFRLEHILGVLARLEQVITTLRQNQARRIDHKLPALPTASQLTKMRLAALCHDIGHCLFSHVSENVIGGLPGNNSYPSATTIKTKFAEWAGRKIPLSEILSIAILTSPVFIKYLNGIGMEGANPLQEAEKVAFDAAHLIAGLPIPSDPNSLFLAQLMNSGLDVDKLDYMFRDSLYSGISLGISLQWLMKKLYIALIPGPQLPNGLLQRIHQFSDKEGFFAVLALERGGQFGFEEFCVARVALYEKIYLHQKNRSAVAEVKTLLNQIAIRVPSYNQVHKWLYLSESIVFPPEGESKIPKLPHLPLFEGMAIEVAPLPSELDWSKLRHRRLPARAYAFGWQNSISDPLNPDYRDDPASTSVGKLIKILRDTPDEFIHAIQKHLRNIERLLNKKLKTETVEERVAKIEILVDPPGDAEIQQGTDTIHIDYPPRLSLRWVMPIDQLEKYYYWNRALGYVFTRDKDVPHVLLAAEMAAWELSGVVCVQDGLVNKESVDLTRQMRIKLEHEQFYDDAPPLRPVSAELESVRTQMKVLKIAQTLAPYESKTQKRVTPASVTTFVAQFPAELQDAAVKWLEYIDFVRPGEELKKLIPAVVNDLPPTYKNIGISPLGATTDSASHLSYNLREALDQAGGNTRIIRPAPLREALGEELDAYVVFDDNTNSGYQALNILAGWLGLGRKIPKNLRLPEDHVQPLTQKLRTELRRKPLYLLFGVATEGALVRLEKYLTDECEMKKDRIQCRASMELNASKKIFSAESPFQSDMKLKLRDYVADVAEQIFISEGKTEKNAKSRALGDNKAEAMVVFPYNCPTMTIPALWLTGIYKKRQWLPLVERGRRRSPKGGFSGEDA